MEGAKEFGLRNVSSHCSISDMDDYDLSRLLDKPRLNIERQRSFDERSLSELSIGLTRAGLDNIDSTYSPGGRSGFDTPASSARNSFEPHPMVAEAWEALRRSLVFFRSQPVGTIAAYDHASEEVLNYDQVFVRDFVPSALAFLMNGEPEIVKNFLLKTLQLQGWEKRIDRFKLGEGAMPASFKVLHDPIRKSDTIVADFGESAIGRVAPVDSGFWWIILLRAYTKSTGDLTLAETEDCQKGMRLILTLCLSEGFDTFPTLLCADGCSMIDRRMVNGSESIDEEDQASQVSQFLEGYKEGRIMKERIGGPSFMGFMSSFIGIGTVYIIGFVVVVMMLIRSINKGDDEHPAVATGDQIDHASSEAKSREHKSGEKED